MNSHDSAAPQFEAWESKARLTLELVVLGVFIPYLLFIAWHRLREGDLTWLLLAGAGAAYLVEIGRAVKHWIKPILVISDRTLEYRWVHFSRRKRISADEIVGLRSSTPHRVVIETRHGRNFAIWLRYLPKAKRAEARAAIERWVAANAPKDLGGSSLAGRS